MGYLPWGRRPAGRSCYGGTLGKNKLCLQNAAMPSQTGYPAAQREGRDRAGVSVKPTCARYPRGLRQGLQEGGRRVSRTDWCRRMQPDAGAGVRLQRVHLAFSGAGTSMPGHTETPRSPSSAENPGTGKEHDGPNPQTDRWPPLILTITNDGTHPMTSPLCTLESRCRAPC